MKRAFIGGLLGAGVLLLLTSCVVRHHHHHPRPVKVRATHAAPPPERQPPPPPPPDRTPPPPDRTPTHRAPPAHRAPPPPDRTPTHRAPPAPPRPAMVIDVTPRSAKRGKDVMLHLTPMRSPVVVYFNGRPLPKRIQGNSVRITVPGNAAAGPAQIEVEWQGRRYLAPGFTVR